MQHIILLHTNDIHGRSEGFARVLTLIEKIRAENADVPVLYVDCGDSEDTTNALSNATKGYSMHRLLGLAQPTAVVVGNGSIGRYGYQTLTRHAEALGCPLLLANLLLPDGGMIPGLQPILLHQTGDLVLGFVGVTAPNHSYHRFFNLQIRDTVKVVRDAAQDLKAQGAHAVIVLSHLGIRNEFMPPGLPDDYDLAQAVQGKVLLILGAHSHDLLRDGEQQGDVWIAQAGNYAEHLGRIDLTWDGSCVSVERISVIPITEDIPVSPKVAQLEAEIARDVETFLNEPIADLDRPFVWSDSEYCSLGQLGADAMRDRMGAEVGLMAVSACFAAGLPAGRLRRGTLWDACPSTGNPGIVQMTGAQLEAVIRKGHDPAMIEARPNAIRGRKSGLLHLSGAAFSGDEVVIGGAPVDHARHYRVAATDFVLEPLFNYTEAAWKLEAEYEVPTIVREVIEDYLKAHFPLKGST